MLSKLTKVDNSCVSAQNIWLRADKAVFAGSIASVLYQKKSADEYFCLLLVTYYECFPTERACQRWFTKFRNRDFDIQDKERSRQVNKFENEELEALMDQDSCQTRYKHKIMQLS